MGGHNDNGNSNGPHEDVSRQIFEKTYKLSIFSAFLCVCVRRHAYLADRHFETQHVRQRGRG